MRSRTAASLRAGAVLSLIGMILCLAPIAWGVSRLSVGETGKGLLFLVIGLGGFVGGGINLLNSRRAEAGENSS